MIFRIDSSSVDGGNVKERVLIESKTLLKKLLWSKD
jgi:hypothetical protein